MKSIDKVFAVLAAIAFVAIAGVGLGIGGCEKLIETASGGQMPMKCHWSFVAIPFIAAIGIIASLLSLAGDSKRSKQVCGAVSVATCAVIAAIPSPIGVGLCTNASMSCHQTYYITLGIMALAAIFSLVAIVKATGSDSKLEIPKASL